MEILDTGISVEFERVRSPIFRSSVHDKANFGDLDDISDVFVLGDGKMLVLSVTLVLEQVTHVILDEAGDGCATLELDFVEVIVGVAVWLGSRRLVGCGRRWRRGRRWGRLGRSG